MLYDKKMYCPMDERVNKKAAANEWSWAFTDIHFVLFEGAAMFVDQVSVQGKPGTNKSVAQFYVNTSTDGIHFVYNRDESGYQVKNYCLLIDCAWPIQLKQQGEAYTLKCFTQNHRNALGNFKKGDSLGLVYQRDWDCFNACKQSINIAQCSLY